MVAIYKIKEVLTHNKPAYVGMWILHLSNTLMYELLYNYIKESYGKKGRLLFTVIDSLKQEIKINYVYKDSYKNKDLFDFSEYPENLKFYNATNKNLLGKIKDQTEGNPIVEFLGLKESMYPFIKEDHQGDKY